MTTAVRQKSPYNKKHDEQILVVKRDKLFADIPAWHGLAAGEINEQLRCIREHQEFHPRSLMEVDPSFKQIIPYLVYQFGDKLFLMERSASASEVRLQSKLSLGIGGHMRQEDIDGATVMDWARREFHEEIAFDGTFEITPLGMLNDDSNEVGRVHIGLVLLLKGSSDAIAVKSELKSGRLVTFDEIRERYDALEEWSKHVFDFLA